MAAAGLGERRYDSTLIQPALHERLEPRQSHGDEAWVVNRALHWNEWADFTEDEFREVAEACKSVLEQLRCNEPECGSLLYVSPRKGEAEALRCRCGAFNLNLTAK